MQGFKYELRKFLVLMGAILGCEVGSTGVTGLVRNHSNAPEIIVGLLFTVVGYLVASYFLSRIQVI